MVTRLYVEKKAPYAAEARALRAELRDAAGIRGLRGLRIVQRYDVEGGVPDAARALLAEPPLDDTLDALPEADYVCAVEYLPGQFDQRADSAAECVALVTGGGRPQAASARIYLFYGELDDAARQKIERCLINGVEARRASLEPAATLSRAAPAPPDIPVLEGFTRLSGGTRQKYIDEYRLALDENDFRVCEDYFRAEGRDPTLTELRVIDTYWSDHCRHSTFNAALDRVEIDDDEIRRAYQSYLELRREVYGAAAPPPSLMDMATIAAKAFHKRGKLAAWDKNDEVNACSIKVQDVDGEDWLLFFKNETHNHPTEIEPFGGAATCIGGAIRDPLSGRSYVYNAVRISGAGDITAAFEAALPGKLPQRKISVSAAQGFSSYGNQAGVATGLVHEYYHPGYVAKRLELGVALGAAPCRNVRRETPAPGDVVILLGGRTGRDGCGGATGSSKSHTAESLSASGAEVQKGNAPVERKIQRLFRNAEAARLIKRCNDFGAGGVAVAIGELADGVSIDLDAVPRKYEGLDGTELAISESQERMAVVVSAACAPRFQALAGEENLESAIVARIIAEPVMVMRWRGREIVRLSRAFLSSNGAQKHAAAHIPRARQPVTRPAARKSAREALCARAGDLAFCSHKGLAERFDSTIGAGAVLMPFGGAHQLSPAQVSCALLPVDGETTVCSGLAAGFDPYFAEESPFHGAYRAVITSVAKLSAAGFERRNCYLSFQEYFERLGGDSERWGKPAAALLGALKAQLELETAAIGGKDSMSGSFENLHVPPALISFACAAGDARRVLSPEFKKAGALVVLLRLSQTASAPDAPPAYPALFDLVERAITQKKCVSAWVIERGGVAEALLKMCFGNRRGFSACADLPLETLEAADCGAFVCELDGDGETAFDGVEAAFAAGGVIEAVKLGRLCEDFSFVWGDEKIPLDEIQELSEGRLEAVFPYRAAPAAADPGSTAALCAGAARAKPLPVWTRTEGAARPRALVPVFPGTNCEYDTLRALARAGARAEALVIRNRTPDETAESIAELARKIAESQMLVLPGGFSGADEPDGSAKLIAAFFRAGAARDAVMELLETRAGLILGICNGFQALVKLGLVPFGKIIDIKDDFPALTFNTIGRHMSLMVRTRIVSALSPWFLAEEAGAVHTIPVSHGEGRFTAPPELLAALAARAQIACQYVDLSGAPSMDIRFNPAGSVWAIEAVSSPCGRVLGKMAHSERAGAWLYKNIPGNTFQKIFEGGVRYFT